MENGENYLTIKTEDAPIRVVGDNEKRQYYLFREKDSKYPIEVIITEVPPKSIQPFHRHETIDELTVVLSGEAVGIIKDENGENKDIQIQQLSFYDPKVNELNAIMAAEDGILLLVLKDKMTGEISGGELPLDEWFDAGKTWHTISNKTDSVCMTATIKKTTSQILKDNPKIFIDDKINFK
jgi:hypothetical protein